MPVLSIVDETVFALKRRGIRRVGIIATSGTIKSKIYPKGLAAQGIAMLKPNKHEQGLVSLTILKILDGTVSEEDKEKLIRIAGAMLDKGAEVVLLACTDLQHLIQKEDLSGKTVDTLEILLNSTFEKMISSYVDL